MASSGAIGGSGSCFGAAAGGFAVGAVAIFSTGFSGSFSLDQDVADQAGEKKRDAGDQDRGNALVDLHAVHAA